MKLRNNQINRNISFRICLNYDFLNSQFTIPTTCYFVWVLKKHEIDWAKLQNVSFWCPIFITRIIIKPKISISIPVLNLNILFSIYSRVLKFPGKICIKNMWTRFRRRESSFLFLKQFLLRNLRTRLYSTQVSLELR